MIIKKCIECGKDFYTQPCRIKVGKGKYCSRNCSPKFINPERRFWDKVKKTITCWEWIGQKNSDGYGIIYVKGLGMGAHRFSYRLNREIPENLYVLHSCDNPSCVNPKHLFVGTQQDNMQDMLKKGRQFYPKGENAGMSKLTKNQINKIRELYKTGKYFQKDLANKYGISQTNVSCIILNKSWK